MTILYTCVSMYAKLICTTNLSLSYEELVGPERDRLFEVGKNNFWSSAYFEDYIVVALVGCDHRPSPHAFTDRDSNQIWSGLHISIYHDLI